MTNKKFKLGAIVALSSITALSAASATVLTSFNGKKTVKAVPAKKASTKTNTEPNATYYTVTFAKPTSGPATDVVLIGKTKVSVKSGYPFGTIVPPQAKLEGYSLDGWTSNAGGSEEGRIPKTRAVTGDMTVYPIMKSITGSITVAPDTTTFFDGFKQSHEWVATVDEDTLAQNVAWDCVDSSGTSHPEAVTITSTYDETEHTSTATITPKTTPAAIENLSIVAKVGTGTGAPQVTTPIAIYPPFYRAGEFPCGAETEVDVGALFWDYEDTIGWYGIDPTTACTDVTTTAIKTYSFDLSSTGTIGSRTRTDTSWSTATVLFPGSDVVEIPDYCFANMGTSFNPNFGQGVYDAQESGVYLPKEITRVGDSFFANCIGFNQNINDYFQVTGDLTIGNECFSGCTAFNNGATAGTSVEFAMPKATIIGSGFMSDCVNFNPTSAVLASTTWYIGDFFMNGCDKVSNFTISSASEDVLQYVGGYFLADCPGLRSLTFDTTNVQYMSDLYVSWADKGSFTWHYTGSHPTDEIIVSGASAATIREYYPSFDIDVGEGIHYCRHLAQ